MEDQKTEEEVIVEEGEVMRKEYEFIPSALCKYKQRGPYLICMSCEIQHATWIGMEKIMVGEDTDGKPIVKSRFEPQAGDC